jgi:Tol biopolymer transport system component
MRRYVTLAAQALGLALASCLATEALAGPRYSDWGPAINVNPGCDGINSVVDDAGPGISRDGLSLYFGSLRAASGAQGGLDLWVATRPSVDAPWGSPVNLGTVVNSAVTDNVPTITRDGHWMFFNSNRPGGVGAGNVDIWLTHRHDVHDDFAWGTPVNLGPGVNTTGFDGGASYFKNKRGGAPQLFYGSGPTLATLQIWVAELLPDEICGGHPCFANAHAVSELKSNSADQRPSIRRDGLEMFFSSNRPGSIDGSQDIWVTIRNGASDEWREPVPLGPAVNAAASDMSPNLSADGLTLYFASNRPGCGGYDLYVTSRTRLTDDDRDDDDDEREGD